jgi:hypothetical protein
MKRVAIYIPKPIAAALALALATAIAAAPAGCAQKTEKPVPAKPAAQETYPVIEQFKDAGTASKAAGFNIEIPKYAMGAKLDHVTVVKVATDRKYAVLYYDKNLTIVERPRDKSSSYQTAMAEHQEYINILTPRLQTNEQPETVDIAGHKGILWMYKGGIVVEKRPITGVQSFHMPYLVWWDDNLEYRLYIDDPRIYEPDPAAGTKELEKIAGSIY